ncbi:MAG: hypothetical protein WD184_07995 [Acidimicrobiia bacterium]
MPRQMLAAVGILIVAAACSGSGTEPSTTAASSTAPTVTTSSTTAPVNPPLLGSVNEPFNPQIRVVEDAVLRVDGSCVTAETGDTAILLVFDLPVEPPPGGGRYVWVQGVEVHFGDVVPPTPTQVLSSGARYQFRGIPFDAVDGELAEPMPPSCVYDEQLILLGALDAPVGHGLTTRPVEVLEGIPAIGINSTTITIAGACTTVGSGEHQLLVVWPAGTVSLLDDHTIHMSRWEALTEVVVRSGDTVSISGGSSDGTPDDPPPDCEYDGTFSAQVIRPVSE